MCYIELTSEDQDTGESRGIDAAISGTNTITFSTTQLRENRHYNVSVTANNSAGYSESYITLSIHPLIIITS